MYQRVLYIYADELVHCMVVDCKLYCTGNVVHPIVLPIDHSMALKEDCVVNLLLLVAWLLWVNMVFVSLACPWCPNNIPYSGFITGCIICKGSIGICGSLFLINVVDVLLILLLWSVLWMSVAFTILSRYMMKLLFLYSSKCTVCSCVNDIGNSFIIRFKLLSEHKNAHNYQINKF